MVTNQDKKAAAEIIKRLRPTKKLHTEYLKSAQSCMANFKYYKSLMPKELSNLYKMEIVHSLNFDLNYLVAFANKKWLSALAPSCDAVASSDFQFANIKAPPLVIVPGKNISKKPGTLSILEHEFVHVNQAILGQISNLDSCELKDKTLFEHLMRHTVAEFEAHVIQLVNDPTLLPPPEYKMTLIQWCYLRAFTSGLERLVLRMLQNKISKNNLDNFINYLKANIENGFLKNNLDLKVATEYVKSMDYFVSAAFKNIAEHI